MRFISLFTGVGGLDLGLERAGWECVAQVENDEWCTKILNKHWPNVPKWKDIHDVTPSDLPNTDAIVGGFPCQPVSLAGKRQAQDDERWLWPEFLRIIRAIRPRIVLVENVSGLFSAGFGDVVGGLAAAGYDAEWASVPAAAVGAPHLRWRVFIVAYPDTVGWDGWPREQRPGWRREPTDEDWWAVEPDIRRVDSGVPKRLDRLRGLGDAVVPQVAEWVGNMINLGTAPPVGDAAGRADQCPDERITQ